MSGTATHDSASCANRKDEVLLGRMRAHLTTPAHIFAYLSEYYCPPDTLMCIQKPFHWCMLISVRQMPQKKWATPEQEEFLLSHFLEFRTHALNKHYKDFLKRVEVEWFQRWPERKVSFPDLPAEHVYTAEEEEYIATHMKTRQKASQEYAHCAK